MQYIDEKKNDSLNLRVPFTLKRKLKEYAAFQDLTLSELCVRMLSGAVGQAQYTEWRESDDE